MPSPASPRGLNHVCLGKTGILDPVRVNKFLHGCQSSYNFIIIDLPFDAAISKFSDMINQADHVVLVEKLNNHGMMNFMLDMLNIEDEQLMEDMFDKAKLVFNMDDGCTSLFGKKVSSTTQALTALDIRASELAEILYQQSII